MVRRLKIVVAEDEAIIRLDLVEMLTDEGYEVVGETGRGDEVFELVDRLKPDLVMMDVKMPGLDGLSAAKLISVDRLAAVIVLTAFSQRELIETARDAGVMAYLVKPFNQAEVVAAIEVASSRFREVVAIASEAATLEDQLTTRKLVDRAKSKLQKSGMSEDEAFRHLQKQAMDLRTSMRAIAQLVVDSTAEAI
jgi:two-component system, response regulator PdtaR